MAPIQLPDVAVTSPAVGQIVPLDLSAVTSLLPFQPGTPPAYLRIYNETGCTFDYQSASGVRDTIPSGAWPLIPMTSKDTGVSLKVKNIQAVAPISVVSATFYPPGEPIPQMPVLGNAPIGQSRVISIPTMPHLIGAVSHPLGVAVGALFAITGILATPNASAITVYIYAFSLVLRGLRYGAFNFVLQYQNASSVSLGTQTIATVELFAGTPDRQLAQPLPAGPFGTPANTAQIQMLGQFSNTDSYPATGTAYLNGIVAFDVDPLGQTPPPAIGNGAATPVGANY